MPALSPMDTRVGPKLLPRNLLRWAVLNFKEPLAEKEWLKRPQGIQTDLGPGRGEEPC